MTRPTSGQRVALKHVSSLMERAAAVVGTSAPTPEEVEQARAWLREASVLTRDIAVREQIGRYLQVLRLEQIRAIRAAQSIPDRAGHRRPGFVTWLKTQPLRGPHGELGRYMRLEDGLGGVRLTPRQLAVYLRERHANPALIRAVDQAGREWRRQVKP